jgi:dihydrofolate reductase
MAKLIYIANTSLDGYTEDRDGAIDWGAPDEEYFDSLNGIQREVDTYLYGRLMYEAMVYWETAPLTDQPSWIIEFTNTWRAAEKVVYSRSLEVTSSDRTTLERAFDIEAIRQRKAGTSGDLTVGGSTLAGQAFGAGLVDECHVFVWPLVLGGGKHAFSNETRVSLHLLDEQRFHSGIVHLRYRIDD